MPTRFGGASHILYESELPAGIFDEDRLQDDIKNQRRRRRRGTIQTDERDEHEIPKHLQRTRRYITSGSNRKIPHVLFIETAIFVDRDLFRHMAKNLSLIHI